MGLVAVITAKELIAAVACQSHGYVLASHAADVKRRHHGGIAKGLYQRACQLFKSLFDIRLDHNFMVVCAKMPCHSARVLCFVEVLVGEANRKGLDFA